MKFVHFDHRSVFSSFKDLYESTLVLNYDHAKHYLQQSIVDDVLEKSAALLYTFLSTESTFLSMAGAHISMLSTQDCKSLGAAPKVLKILVYGTCVRSYGVRYSALVGIVGICNIKTGSQHIFWLLNFVISIRYT